MDAQLHDQPFASSDRLAQQSVVLALGSQRVKSFGAAIQGDWITAVGCEGCVEAFKRGLEILDECV